MAKYFLGSVGKAEALRMNPESKEMEVLFVSKTLTDSGLNISTTKDDIRGGQGAPIQFSFYHDASVEITLTDIQWKKEYLTAQLGAEFEGNVGEAYQTKKHVPASELEAGLELEVSKLPGIHCKETGEVYAIWAYAEGTDNKPVMLKKNGNKFFYDGTIEDEYYCVRYLALDSRAQVAEITSNIIPSELYLIISAPIYAGDACAASRGKAAGEIQFDVPRFLLNGGQEFTMNMSSNQTMNLSGIALASESSDCEANGGMLLKVREVIYDRKWYDEVENLVADVDSLKANMTPEIYGITHDRKVVVAFLKDLTFTPALVDGKWPAPAEGAESHKVTFKVTENDKIIGEATILKA